MGDRDGRDPQTRLRVTDMKFNRLVYTEARAADGGGRSMTVDFELEEITVDSSGGGVRWCRLGTHERSTVDAKLNSSRPENWADRYAAPLGDGLDWTLRLSDTGPEAQETPAAWSSGGTGDSAEQNASLGDDLAWTLRLFDGAELVKTSCGTNRFPPAEQWNAFRLLTDFCFTVTRRYGAPPIPS